MNMLDSLMLWVEEREAPTQVVLSYDEERKEWSGSMFHGKEAEDSPMWGGAAHSIAATPHEALSQVMTEFHVPLEQAGSDG